MQRGLSAKQTGGLKIQSLRPFGAPPFAREALKAEVNPRPTGETSTLRGEIPVVPHRRLNAAASRAENEVSTLRFRRLLCGTTPFPLPHRGEFPKRGEQVGLNNFPPRGIAAAVLAKNVPPAHFLNATTFHILFGHTKRIWPSETSIPPPHIRSAPPFTQGRL